MGMLEISVDAADLRALEELGDQLTRDPTPVLEEIAEELERLLHDHLEAADFPALSPVTLEIRERRGRTGKIPLVDTGDMRSRIRSRVKGDTAAAGAPWPALVHQVGFQASEEAAIPGVSVPARPFVYVDDDEMEPLIDRIEDWHLGPPSGI